jgi:hypothetical protein
VDKTLKNSSAEKEYEAAYDSIFKAHLGVTILVSFRTQTKAKLRPI